MTTAAELAKWLRNRCSLMRQGLACDSGTCRMNYEAADLLDRVAKLEAVAEAAMKVAAYMGEEEPDELEPWPEFYSSIRALEEK